MSRPTKKRGYDESVVVVETGEQGSSRSGGGGAFRRSPNNPSSSSSPSSFRLDPFVLEQQCQALKLELEHERSMRQLDKNRCQHKLERMEKQVELALEDAAEATRALEDFRLQSEKTIHQLRESRNQAMEELRKVQIAKLETDEAAGTDDDYDEEEDDDDDDDDNNGEETRRPTRARRSSRHSSTPKETASMATVWKEKCHHLEQLLETQRASEAELYQRLASLRSELEAKAAERDSFVSQQKQQQQASALLSPGASEKAPPAVIKELNRVRIALGDAERRERQWSRQVQDLTRRNKHLLQKQEEGRLAVERLPVLQQQLTELLTTHETLVVQHEAWNNFGHALETLIFQDTKDMMENATPEKAKRSTGGGPPELSSIQRFLQNAKLLASSLEEQKATLVEQNKQLKASILPLETQIKSLSESEQAAQREKRTAERNLEQAERQVKQLQANSLIYKREIDSLQSLIKTLDDLPLGGSGGGTGKDSPSSASVQTLKTLEISLASAREELLLVTTEKDRLSKEASEAHDELERVKEKFAKLRDALHAERAKAEQAEARANEAEALAGKGMFNPETTRVLHLQETPLTEALKEEIKVLQRQLEAANNKGAAAAAAAAKSKHPDPDKLNKRLKENFQEQIALFRQGVYLMTGFKVDMLPNTDRPTFRVRSMFAEHEEDHVMLKWPKAEEVASLDLLNTAWAKTLTTTPAYEYMTKCHSLPAFLAAVQLDLFSKQTVLM